MRRLEIDMLHASMECTDELRDGDETAIGTDAAREREIRRQREVA